MAISDDDTLGAKVADLARITRNTAARLDGEIAERSQRQLEIAGRLAALERDMRACIETLRTPTDVPERLKQIERRMDSIDGGPGVRSTDAERMDRKHADAVVEAIEYARMHAVACDVRHSYLPATHKEAGTWLPHSWVVDAIMALQHDLANARADAQVHQSARHTLEQWEAQVRTALGVPLGESRKWMVAEIVRMKTFEKETRETRGRLARRIGDLESQVAALQKAINDVWTLVEQPDGYGSPDWLDDTTPAQAVERVLKHLHKQLKIERGSLAYERHADQARRIYDGPLGAHAEAMAALNAADRQSDDDQICGC